MRRHHGFTLIELILFIIVSSILASAILLAYVGALQRSPSVMQNTIATETARQCMEWYLAQRRLNGYSSVSGANCTGTLSTPNFCTIPSGYSLTASCTQTTIGGDSDYETITINVSGPGNATLSLLLGDY